ncbi:PE family protein [Mycobacterium ulcerans str. Harvey]|uniref:PE family protein n=2 Tax=Mycobacterium ulcerans TaxID=1809 RepID=A0ABP3AT12_MYCUL|nr:PE family protein [Mycobacterium ulcerans str. Harvey]
MQLPSLQSIAHTAPAAPQDPCRRHGPFGGSPMSYVFAAHELMAVAAGELNDIGALVGSANTAAAASTTDLMAAAGDEVSLAIARVFGAYGRDYQAFGVQAAEFHERFV